MDRIKNLIEAIHKSSDILAEKDLLNMISSTICTINCTTTMSKKDRQWVSKQVRSQNVSSVLAKYDTYGNGVCLYQIHGTQQPPDFTFIVDGKTVSIEGKSSKVNQPQFNSHMPEPNTIHVISISAGNFIAMGSDLFPKNQAKMLDRIYVWMNHILTRLWSKYLPNLEYWQQDYLRIMGKFQWAPLKKNDRSLYDNVIQYLDTL